MWKVSAVDCWFLITVRSWCLSPGPSRGLRGSFTAGVWADPGAVQAFGSGEVAFLQACVASSRAPSTLRRYDGPWEAFTLWCEGKGVASLPATPMVVSMYFAALLRQVVQRGHSFAVIKASSAAIYQAHRLAGVGQEVTSHPAVAAVRECAMRVLGTATKNRKEPVSLDVCMLVVASCAGEGASLVQLQLACLVMVSFAGFLRYSDVVSVCADQIRFYPTHMEVFLEKRKTLQFREGDVIYIARGSSFACPVALVSRLLSLSGLRGRHEPIFREVLDDGSLGSSAWPYRQARTAVLSAFSSVLGVSVAVLEVLYGLHSLRSGGATCVAGSGVPLHVFQQHGGWRTATAMQVYIKPTTEQRLLPTTAMRY